MTPGILMPSVTENTHVMVDTLFWRLRRQVGQELQYKFSLSIHGSQLPIDVQILIASF